MKAYTSTPELELFPESFIKSIPAAETCHHGNRPAHRTLRVPSQAIRTSSPHSVPRGLLSPRGGEGTLALPLLVHVNLRPTVLKFDDFSSCIFVSHVSHHQR